MSQAEFQQLDADIHNAQNAESVCRVQAKLRAAIEAGDDAVLEYVLSDLGQERGYIKRRPRKRKTPVGVAA